MVKVVLNSCLSGMSDLNCDCCDWLMQHANEAEDTSFRELVKTLSAKSWDEQYHALINYFEDKRSHPLLIKCIETVSNCWPYHIEEYDENLFNCTVDVKEEYDPEYNIVTTVESLTLIPLIRKVEVSELMKCNDFHGIVAYLKARNINMVVE